MEYVSNISSQFSFASYLTPAMPCLEISRECIQTLALRVGFSAFLSKTQGSDVVSFGTAMRIVLGLGYTPLFVNAVETFARSSYNLIKAAPDLKWFTKSIPNTALALFQGEQSVAKRAQTQTENAFKKDVGVKLYNLLGAGKSTWTNASYDDICKWTAGDTAQNMADPALKNFTPAKRKNILIEIKALSGITAFTDVYLPMRAENAKAVEKCKENKPPRSNADTKAARVRRSAIFRNFVWMGVSIGTGLLSSQNQIIDLVKSRFTDQTSFAASVFNSTLPVATATCDQVAQNAGILSSLMGLGFRVLSFGLSNGLPILYSWNIYRAHSTGGLRNSAAALNGCLALDALWFNALPISLFGGIAQAFGFFTTYDVETAGKITMCAPLVATLALKCLGSAIIGKGIAGKATGILSSAASTILGESNKTAIQRSMTWSMTYSGLSKGSDIICSVFQRGWNCTMLSHLPQATAV